MQASIHLGMDLIPEDEFSMNLDGRLLTASGLIQSTHVFVYVTQVNLAKQFKQEDRYLLSKLETPC